MTSLASSPKELRAFRKGAEVSISMVVENLHANASHVKQLLRTAITGLSRKRTCACVKAVQYAVFTQPYAINKATLKKLELLVGQYIKPKKKKK